MHVSVIKALRDVFALSEDDSPEAVLGECGFSEQEMAAAPQVPVEDIDETD